MSKAHAVAIEPMTDWQMPLWPERYDRSATLTEAERVALADVGALASQQHLLLPGRPSTHILARLTQPLQDVYQLGHTHPDALIPFLRYMYQQMARLEKPFWAWSEEEWVSAMLPAHAPADGIRATMRVVAYLLCDLLIIDEHFLSYHLACVVFGTGCMREQYERLARVIFGKDGLGYARGQRGESRLRTAVTLTLLSNRTPSLDAITFESLQAVKQVLSRDYQYAVHWMARALVSLGILEKETLTKLAGGHAGAPVWWDYSKPDVDPRWLAWVQAYIAHTNRYEERYRQSTFYQLIIAGRWLKQYHPSVALPEQWDEVLAQDYVSWVCSAKRGELVSDLANIHESSSPDRTLQASTVERRLGALKLFFKALQRRAYQVDGEPAQRLALSWSPDELLATPEPIRRQRIPNPRNLDHGWWQKLTWAAATLSAKDLSSNHTAYLPLVYYRAVGLLWVTGARRSDEIRRLKVGCVSREWAPEMRDEEGHQLEAEADLCYVRVPVNKLQGEFWVPIPTYTADAIEAWERLRPKLQDARIDRKEHKLTDYLFLMRDQLMGRDFLNRSVIPLLCKAAGLVDEQGVPLRDAVGKITSHRARSTLATWLRSNGLSLTYIAKLLGHTDLKTLPWYLREDKYRFARALRQHNPLERMVTAILDPEALKRGAGEPAVFYYLGDGADGRPHMCASPDYQRCVHQMRCTECEMHVDAEQAEVIAHRPGVLTIEVRIPTPPMVADLLTQEEELGVEITCHLPAPSVPSPAYHFNQAVLPRSSDPQLQRMKKELEELMTEWVEKEGKFDLRSVVMKSLKKCIANLAARIEAQEGTPPGDQINPT